MMDFIIAHKNKLIGVAVLLLVLGGGFAAYVNHRLTQPFMTADKMAALRSEVAAQNEAGLSMPPPQAGTYATPSVDRNVYFGDMHVHSSLSFDSYIFGNRWGLDDA